MGVDLKPSLAAGFVSKHCGSYRYVKRIVKAEHRYYYLLRGVQPSVTQSVGLGTQYYCARFRKVYKVIRFCRIGKGSGVGGNAMRG